MSREQEERKMRCPVQDGNPEILLEYSSRRLAPEMVAVLERHMLVCPECVRFSQAQQRIWSALDDWEPEPVSGSFDQRLYARIESDSRLSWWQRLTAHGFGWKPALAGTMATLAVAAVLVLPGYRNGDPAQPAGLRTNQSRSENLEPEQVERALDDLEMLRQLSSAAAGASAHAM